MIERTHLKEWTEFVVVAAFSFHSIDAVANWFKCLLMFCYVHAIFCCWISQRKSNTQIEYDKMNLSDFNHLLMFTKYFAENIYCMWNVFPSFYYHSSHACMLWNDQTIKMACALKRFCHTNGIQFMWNLFAIFSLSLAFLFVAVSFSSIRSDVPVKRIGMAFHILLNNV